MKLLNESLYFKFIAGNYLCDNNFVCDERNYLSWNIRQEQLLIFKWLRKEEFTFIGHNN